jgi:hypothetical protein
MTVAGEQSGTASAAAFDDNGDDTSAMQQVLQQYQQVKRERGLTYNHYANVGGSSPDIQI